MTKRKAQPRAPRPRGTASDPASWRNYMGPEKLEAWIRENVAPGAVFYLGTSPFTITGNLGFWSGDEPVTDRQTLAKLQRAGVLRCEAAFWRGMRCVRT